MSASQYDEPSEHLARLYALDADTWAAINARQEQAQEVGRTGLADRIAQRAHEAELAAIRREMELVEARLELSLARRAVGLPEEPRPVPEQGGPGTVPVPAPVPSAVPSPGPTEPGDRALVEQIRAWIADPRDPGPTGELVRQRFRIRKGKALELLRMAKEESR